eukprot:scaffold10191_cov67-Cylindrotheca_fusiformis.AAC.1
MSKVEKMFEGYVTLGNGNTVKIQKYGQVAGQFVDKQGEKMMKAILDEVAYYPGSATNAIKDNNKASADVQDDKERFDTDVEIEN